MNLLHPPERLDQLAAAYALGTLRGPARRRFEALARERPDIRAAALLWQERLSGLTELQAQVVPDPRVWQGIEQTLSRELGRELFAAPAGPVQAVAGKAAQAAMPSPKEALLNATQRALAWWRAVAVTGFVAAMLALVVLVPGRRDDAPVQTLAVLNDQAQAPVLLVSLQAEGRVLQVQRLGSYKTPEDRSLQLWAIAPGSTPRSLGVMQTGEVIRLPLAEGRLRGAQVLAVSLEPKGGVSGEQGPSGPVLFQGAVLTPGKGT